MNFRSHMSALGGLVVSGGVIAAAMAAAAPAQADSNADAFLRALTATGLPSADPVDTVALGQSVCPMLADSGQTTADIAAKVADAGGMSLGPATMFTGLAISIFCPGAVAKIGNGQIDGLPVIDSLPAIKSLNDLLNQ